MTVSAQIVFSATRLRAPCRSNRRNAQVQSLVLTVTGPRQNIRAIGAWSPSQACCRIPDTHYQSATIGQRSIRMYTDRVATASDSKSRRKPVLLIGLTLHCKGMPNLLKCDGKRFAGVRLGFRFSWLDCPRLLDRFGGGLWLLHSWFGATCEV